MFYSTTPADGQILSRKTLLTLPPDSWSDSWTRSSEQRPRDATQSEGVGVSARRSGCLLTSRKRVVGGEIVALCRTFVDTHLVKVQRMLRVSAEVLIDLVTLMWDERHKSQRREGERVTTPSAGGDVPVVRRSQV